MKKTKKLLTVLGISMALAAAPTTAFGFGWKSAKSAAAETTAASELKYEFKTDKAVIAVGAEAAPILKELGTAKKTFEQDSCAYQGKDKVYSYDGFDICTYPVNGKDYISAIYIMDDTVSTPEGIKIGSSKQDVINAYGKEYKEEFGVYRYTAGNTELSIYTTNQVVDSIEYLVLTK